MSVSLREAQDRLVHDATHDALTRLPNRALFMERLERALIRRVRHPQYAFAVLFIDLDRFKNVNDSLGHGAGDELLLRVRRTARRRRAPRRRRRRASAPSRADDDAEHTLARFGGDEFVVLLDDIRDPIDAVRVAERMQQLSTAAVHVAGQDVFATPASAWPCATPRTTCRRGSGARRRPGDVSRQARGRQRLRGVRRGHARRTPSTACSSRPSCDSAVERHEFRVLLPADRVARRSTRRRASRRWCDGSIPKRGCCSPAEFLARRRRDRR